MREDYKDAMANLRATQQELANVKAEKDELLALVETTIKNFMGLDVHPTHIVFRNMKALDAFIKKAKGGE